MKKIRLKEIAEVLSDNELKNVVGGSSGVTHACTLKCGPGRDDWYWVTSCSSTITSTCGITYLSCSC
jgi:natural product precursor